MEGWLVKGAQSVLLNDVSSCSAKVLLNVRTKIVGWWIVISSGEGAHKAEGRVFQMAMRLDQVGG